MATVSNTAGYECDICRKSFSSPGAFKMHEWGCWYANKNEKVQTKNKCHQGEDYNTWFSSKDHLKSQVMVPRRAIIDKRNISSHMLLHGKSDFRCEECGLYFAVEDSLTTHMDEHYIVSNENFKNVPAEKYGSAINVTLESSNNEVFDCAEEEALNSSKNAKLRLAKEEKLELENHRCNDCGKFFRSAKSLETHKANNPKSCPAKRREGQSLCKTLRKLRKKEILADIKTKPITQNDLLYDIGSSYVIGGEMLPSSSSKPSLPMCETIHGSTEEFFMADGNVDLQIKEEKPNTETVHNFIDEFFINDGDVDLQIKEEKPESRFVFDGEIDDD